MRKYINRRKKDLVSRGSIVIYDTRILACLVGEFINVLVGKKPDIKYQVRIKGQSGLKPKEKTVTVIRPSSFE